MWDLQSQDYIRRSATTLTPPSARNYEQQVAKLIDVSRCIGCKACQSACMEWNNLRPELGYFAGSRGPVPGASHDTAPTRRNS